MSSAVPNVNPGQRDAFWLRVALAFVWIATGLGVLSPEYQRIGEDYLVRFQLPSWVMWVTCAFEVLLGLRVLLAPMGTILTVLQALSIITFTGGHDLVCDSTARLSGPLRPAPLRF